MGRAERLGGTGGLLIEVLGAAHIGWKRIASDCHLSRDIPGLVTADAFDLDHIGAG